MRDIKFRGLRTPKDGIGWAIGSLILPNAKSDKCYIIGWNGAKFEVIPETVGQFTGLTDANGNEIYEGDIVEFTTYKGGGFPKVGVKCKAVVVYGEYNLQDNVLGGSIGFYLKRVNSEYPISIKYWLYSHKALVTGNIHENN